MQKKCKKNINFQILRTGSVPKSWYETWSQNLVPELTHWFQTWPPKVVQVPSPKLSSVDIPKPIKAKRARAIGGGPECEPARILSRRPTFWVRFPSPLWGSGFVPTFGDEFRPSFQGPSFIFVLPPRAQALGSHSVPKCGDNSRPKKIKIFQTNSSLAYHKKIAWPIKKRTSCTPKLYFPEGGN